MKNYKTNLATSTKTTASTVIINGGMTSHTLEISSNDHFLFSNGGFRGACFSLSQTELDFSFSILDLPCRSANELISSFNDNKHYLTHSFVFAAT